jgi:hypothetical protein
MVEGVNSTVIYCKNFCECHNVPPTNNNKKAEYKSLLFHQTFIEDLL